MSFIHLSLVIYALVYVNMEPIDVSTSTEAVQCNMCVDRFNWTNCDDSAKPRECSDKLVVDTHSFLAQYNFNLNESPTTAERQFRCFRLELQIDVASVQVFIRGCTYDDSFFCDGWTENGAKATNCAVCSTDMCERNTTGDVSPTTTTTNLPSETTTTTAVSTIEMSSTTQSASTAQSSPVTTTVSTEEPCIVDWTTTTTAKGQSTTEVVEKVTTTTTITATPPSQENVTESDAPTISQSQRDQTSYSTDSTNNISSSSEMNVTPAPNILTVGSGVAGKYFSMNTIVVVLLVSIASIFIVKL
ncbi:uncharacterized protein LOC135711317 [Ochlerotatus camptorhynchus]|uniref:uncharacterized protein LOC135711317 n=1 Tax=Ochlerotatus camptorhynchus TaxID=644619 RepID=UPI0031DD67F4